MRNAAMSRRLIACLAAQPMAMPSLTHPPAPNADFAAHPAEATVRGPAKLPDFAGGTRAAQRRLGQAGRNPKVRPSLF